MAAVRGGAGWLQEMGKAEDEYPEQAVVGFTSALCRSLCQMLGPHPLSPQQLCSLCSLGGDSGYGVLCTDDVCAEKQKCHRQRAAAAGDLTGRWDRVAA